MSSIYGIPEQPDGRESKSSYILKAAACKGWTIQDRSHPLEEPTCRAGVHCAIGEIRLRVTMGVHSFKQRFTVPTF